MAAQRLIGLATLVLVAAACRPRVPTPLTGDHDSSDPVVLVPYPPPVARVERVPAPPTEDAVWIDGYWSWTGTGYDWVAGTWKIPLPGRAYAPATTVRLRNGDLLWYAPRWKPASSSP